MSRYRGRRENSFIGLFLDMDTLINRHRQASLRRCDMERLAMYGRHAELCLLMGTPKLS